MIEPRSRGVMDAPHARGMTVWGLLTPPEFVIKYNYSGQEAKSPWETPSPPQAAGNPSC